MAQDSKSFRCTKIQQKSFVTLVPVSYYDISLLYSRIHLKWISLCYCAKSWRQNYLRVDLTSKTTPPPIFLDPVYQSGSTILLYYLKTYFDINKSLRNLTPIRQHVLLIYRPLLCVRLQRQGRCFARYNPILSRKW